ncbi:MAG: hypothetical protein ACRCSN_12810 [Dermatophilaceae bacterium]
MTFAEPVAVRDTPEEDAASVPGFFTLVPRFAVLVEPDPAFDDLDRVVADAAPSVAVVVLRADEVVVDASVAAAGETDRRLFAAGEAGRPLFPVAGASGRR